MGWINILVSIVIPDATAIGVGFAEVVSTLTLACVLQALQSTCSGASTLQGYVEWHVANTLRSIAIANNMPAVDIIILSCVVVATITSTFPKKSNRVSVLDTIVTLFSIVAVNTTAQRMVFIVTKQSSFNIFAALFIFTILLQCVITFYKRIYRVV
jgi:hypothetical protein